MPNDLSVEDIDKILQDLENSLEIRTSEQAANVFEIKDAKEHFSGADSSLLRFECPTALWDEFTEYCKRNEVKEIFVTKCYVMIEDEDKSPLNLLDEESHRRVERWLQTVAADSIFSYSWTI